eukprot:4482761-Prymnesium_polylepis.1
MTDLRRTLAILRRERLEMTPPTSRVRYPYFQDSTLILRRLQLEMGSVNSRWGVPFHKLCVSRSRSPTSSVKCSHRYSRKVPPYTPRHTSTTASPPAHHPTPALHPVPPVDAPGPHARRGPRLLALE